MIESTSPYFNENTAQSNEKKSTHMNLKLTAHNTEVELRVLPRG